MPGSVVLEAGKTARGTSVPSFKHNCSVMEWLQYHGRFSPDIGSLLGGLSERLVKTGIPLDRTMVIVRTLHPTVMGARIDGAAMRARSTCAPSATRAYPTMRI